MKNKEILIVRHGLTSANIDGRVLGVSDIGLTDKGIFEIEGLAKHLKEKGVAPQKIYTSPLKRALHTAKILNRNLGGAVITSPFLSEINYGNYEGQNNSVLERIQYGYNSEQMKSGNGETVGEVEDRVVVFLNDVFEKKDERIFIVTHAFIASIIAQVILGISRTFETIQPLSTADYVYFKVEIGGVKPISVLMYEKCKKPDY